jgi:hypothetical protein
MAASRVTRTAARRSSTPAQPDLRQVHLGHAELHDELRAASFAVAAGEMGENITMRCFELLDFRWTR